MMTKKIILYILFVSTPIFLFSQKNEVDSLLLLLQLTKDSAKVDVYTQLMWKLRNSEPERAIEYGKKTIELATKINYVDGLMKTYSFIGVCYRNLGNYNQAFEYYFSGLELARKHLAYEQQGYAYNNLGNLFIYQEYYEKAVEYLLQSYNISDKINNKKITAYSCLNLGRAFLALGKLDSAIIFLTDAYNIRNELNDMQGKAVCMKYLADIYNEQGFYDKAQTTYNDALNTANFKDDKDLLTDIYNNLSQLFLNKKDYNMAKNYAVQSLRISKDIGLRMRIRDSYQTLANIHFETKEWAKTAEYQRLVILYNDTLFNQQLTERITSLQFESEKQRQQIEIDLLNREKELSDTSMKRQKMLNLTLSMILILAVAFLVLVIISNVARKRANKLLREQKQEIINKNIELKSQNEEIKSQHDEIYLQKKQITDSIQYAGRIQKAILQYETNFNDIVPNNFVFLLPRDIVSGDFFWFAKIENNIIIAAADCTGHGVPGAFMSLLGVSALKEIVEDKLIFETDVILENLRKKIKHALNQESIDSDSKDGMDIAIVNIAPDFSKLLFSGANSPAYICRNKEIITLEATKNPIGIYIKEKKFQKIEISMLSDDMLYLFSDGYHSQFGGTNNEKFKIGRFKNLLISICKEDIATQRRCMVNNFINWKGIQKQVDDILVVGIKF